MLLPDDERSFNTVVRGVARGNATVRIRQNNVVFFEQNVPAGPFEFTRLYPPSTLGDLQVTVTEADGSETRSVVPYAYNGGKLNPGSYRYSLAVGNYRGGINTAETPLLHGYVRYGLDDTWTPTLEAIASADYQALGLQASLYNKYGTFSASTQLARQSGRQGQSGAAQEQSGAAHSAYYYAPPLGPVNVYTGLSYQTEHYVSPNTGLGQLSNTSVGAAASFESSSYLGLSLTMGSYGSLYANARRQTNWNQSAAPEQYSLGYNLFRNGLFFSANLDRSGGGFAGGSVDTVRLSISVPLDMGSNKGWLAASASQQGNYGVAQTVNYNGNTEDNSLSYGLSQSGQDGQSSSGGSVGYQHPYGFAGVSLSTGNNFSQSGLGLSGSLVAHRGGLTLAPPVGDTFAIVEVPNGQGARVNGSNAQVGASGYGVVSYLSPYGFNDVALNLENAPMDLEVDTASQRVAPLDGSIVLLRFKANRGRPLLLQLTLDKGGKLPLGASVLDAQDQEVGQVGQASKAVVRVKGDTGKLTIVWGDKPEQRCTLDYQLGNKDVANASGMTPLTLTCKQAAPDALATF
jgi:outer membrane usher protein